MSCRTESDPLIVTALWKTIPVASLDNGNARWVLSLAEPLSQPLELRRSSLSIWALLEENSGGISTEDLVEILEGRYSVPRGSLAPDISAFVRRLAEAGFVSSTDDGPVAE